MQIAQDAGESFRVNKALNLDLKCDFERAGKVFIINGLNLEMCCEHFEIFVWKWLKNGKYIVRLNFVRHFEIEDYVENFKKSLNGNI
jgi:hypothetical protein